MHYQAPECFGGCGYTIKCDVYSTGITIYEIMCLQIPHLNLDWQLEDDVAVSTVLSLLKKFVLTRMLTVKPKKRASICDVAYEMRSRNLLSDSSVLQQVEKRRQLESIAHGVACFAGISLSCFVIWKSFQLINSTLVPTRAIATKGALKVILFNA